MPPSQLNITVGGPSCVIQPPDQKITIQDAVVLELDGLVVAKLDATYDLEGLHPELQQHAMTAALNARRRISLYRDHDELEPSPEDTLKEEIVKVSWWDRLFRK